MLNPDIPKNPYENIPLTPEEKTEVISNLGSVTPELAPAVDIPEVPPSETPEISEEVGEEKSVLNGAEFSEVVEKVEDQLKKTDPIHPKGLAKLLQRIRSMEAESKKI